MIHVKKDLICLTARPEKTGEQIMHFCVARYSRLARLVPIAGGRVRCPPLSTLKRKSAGSLAESG
jgi:hypothetical protein